MNSSKFENPLEPVIDVIINILYLAGIAVIEVWIRPFFGDRGVPRIANTVLLIGDAVLVLSLLRRLVVALDEFWRALKATMIYKNIKNLLGKRRK